MTTRPGVILELFGTLGEDDGDIRTFQPYACCVPSLRLLEEAGCPAVVVTNHSGITRAIYAAGLRCVDAAVG
jgi:histidinol phosphatase-like enzyme